MSANVVLESPIPNKPVVSATELLSIAVKKRKEICSRKDVGLYRDVITKNLIKTLCKELGQSCVRSRSRSNSRRRRRSRSASSRESSTHKRRLSADSEVPVKKQPSELYGYQQVDYEENCGLYIDEGEGGQCAGGTNVQSAFNEFSSDQSALVSMGSPMEQLVSFCDYSEMERNLDAEKPELDGYIGRWTEQIPTNELPVLLDLDRPTGRSKPKDESISSSLSPLQPQTAENSTDEAKKEERYGGIDLNDPLNLSELFKSSYSIINPSRG